VSQSRVARNTAIFSVFTGLSRIAGLAREIAAAAYFGVTGPASAFTLAFQIPNLIRALVADAALSSAFVPVFTELLEQGRKREAHALAASLLGLILVVIGALVAVAVIGAGLIMPLFAGDEFSPFDVDLLVGLSRVLFPIVVLLAANGLVVGILAAYDHFSIPALAPLVWNIVIIAGLVGLRGLFDDRYEIYAYAIGVLVATAVQLAMVLPVLKRVGFPLRISLDWRDPRLKRVLELMLPVSLGLGVINVDLVINSSIGTLIDTGAPRAIDAAFRVYMLPQGMFSVAVATVLFPQLSRLAARRDRPGLKAWSGGGMRLIFLMLIPCSAILVALAEPITRLVYQRGEFGPGATDATAEALFWFAFSLPFAGANLMLTRTFFALQRPWLPTTLAGVSLVVNTVLSFALYGPLGISGVVLATAISSLVMTLQQVYYLRREVGGFEIVRTLQGLGQMALAAAASGGVAYGVHWLLDDALGRSLAGQLVAVGAAVVASLAAYAGLTLIARIPEARDLARRLA
jgi:putative peptidoglycan lipid II flippase